MATKEHLTQEKRRQRAVDRERQSERDRRERRDTPSEVPNMHGVVTDPHVRQVTVERTSFLLNPYARHNYLQLVAVNEPSVLGTRLTNSVPPAISYEEMQTLQEKGQRKAEVTAQEGIDLLTARLGEKDIVAKLRHTKPFKGLHAQTFLHGLDPDERSYLSVVRYITEGLAESTASDKKKVRLFFAAIAFAQVNIVNDDAPRRNLNARRNEILRYGLILLEHSRQESLLTKIHKLAEKRRRIGRTVVLPPLPQDLRRIG